MDILNEINQLFIESIKNIKILISTAIITLLGSGRQNGVSVIIKEIKGAGLITSIQNTENGVHSMVAGSTRTDISFLNKEQS